MLFSCYWNPTVLTLGGCQYIYFLVDDVEVAVKVNAVIYTGRDQTKQMADRRMEEM